jgi:hypothetical protein
MKAGRMNRVRRLALGFVVALALAGCSSGGGSNSVAPPPPPDDSHEPNDFSPFSLGTLGNQDIVVEATESSDADVDLYSVTLSGTTNLFVELNWASGANLGFALSNNAGITVRNVDTASKPEECTLSAVPAGTYTIRVGSRTTASTPYTLTIGPR